MQTGLRLISRGMFHTSGVVGLNHLNWAHRSPSLSGLHKTCRLFQHRSISSSSASILDGATPGLTEFSGRDPVACLIEWLSYNGADLDGARIRKSAISGMGVVATRDFAADDIILQVPMHAAIMVYPFHEEHDVAIPSKELPDTAIKLALRLLNEKARGKESPWFPYLDALPKQLTNPEEMSKGLMPPHTATRIFPKIIDNYKKTLSFLVSGGTSEQDARWALAVIQSRAFGNGMGQEVLVPLLDSMNHGDNVDDGIFSDEYQANVSYGWQKTGDTNAPKDWAIVVKSRRIISDGEELLVSYGDHENEYFFLFYGFIPMFNPRDDLLLFENADAALNWYCTAYPERVSGLTAMEKEKLLAEVAEQGDLKEVIKMNICADGSVSPIMLDLFATLFDGDLEQAEIAIGRACFDRLQTLPSFLSDLTSLSSTFDGELNIFEYYLATYKKSIQSFMTRNGLSLEECSSGSNGLGDHNVLQRGSPHWWFTVHEMLKKLIAWDYILEVEPSRAALGL